jgi:hypothetical protein
MREIKRRKRDEGERGRSRRKMIMWIKRTLRKGTRRRKRKERREDGEERREGI